MNNHDSDHDNLVSLWEQMGASTGSYIGKLIGLYAQYGLQTYEQLIVNPLKQVSTNAAQSLDYSNQPPDIREQTWSTMGKEYGDKLGSSIGMSMDWFVNSLKTITPPASSDNAPSGSGAEPNQNAQ